MLPFTRGYEIFLHSNSPSSPTKCICLLTLVHFHIQWCKPAWIPVSSRLKLSWTDTKKYKMYPSESVTQKPLSAFLFSSLPKALCWTWHCFFYEKPLPRTEERTLTLGCIRAAWSAGHLGEEQPSIWSAVSSQKWKTLRKVSTAFSPLPNSSRLQLIFLMQTSSVYV